MTWKEMMFGFFGAIVRKITLGGFAYDEDFVGAQAPAGVNCRSLPLIAEVGELYNVYPGFKRRRFSRGPWMRSQIRNGGLGK